MQQLQLDHLTKCYKEFAAVKDVTLTLGGGVYGLLGANGAGKTTLMRMLCGILTPTRGTVRCGGADIARLGEEYRALLGYLPQDFGFYPDFTGPEFLRYIAALKGLTRAETARRTGELLAQVGMSERATHEPNELSGGQKQRVAIARALANHPSLLLADEPTGALDSATSRTVMDIFHDLHRQGMTIVLITHSQQLAEECQRILTLQDGRIVGERKGAGRSA